MADQKHDPTRPRRREALLVPGLLEEVAARARGGSPPPSVAHLRADAEALLPLRPPTVIDKAHVPPTGDKRDYFSLSVYFWPDPTKPDGRPYVPRDGQTNPEIEQFDGPRFTRMSASVDVLACAWAVTGDERYAAKAAELLRAWFLDERTAMLPRMLFAQYIPGENVVLPWKEYPARFVPGTDGRPGVFVSFGGVIEDLQLVPLTDCVRLLRGSRHWRDVDDHGMRDWYRAYTRWVRTHQHGLDEAACRNNHASWYWAGVACFLEFDGQLDEARTCIRDVLGERLRQQVEPDGSQPEELVRAISQSYAAFGLCSFTNIAVTASRCGLDVWEQATADGRAIRKAVDWMLPYVTGERPWTWSQIKPFDAVALAGPLAACARRFPSGPYGRALRGLPIVVNHRARVQFGIDE